MNQEQKPTYEIGEDLRQHLLTAFMQDINVQSFVALSNLKPIEQDADSERNDETDA